MDNGVVRLDGSRGEGGGQILRTALFLSALLGQPFRAERIRAGRKDPGLKAQHLGILRILEDVADARVEGARLGSAAVEFHPGEPRAGAYSYDVGTAGSIPLLLQTLLPVALLCEGEFRLHLTGGTDVPWGPTTDWVSNVLLPRLRPLAETADLQVVRRGFYPRGGGSVELFVRGGPGRSRLPQRVKERLGEDRAAGGRVLRVGGTSLAHEALRDARVAERQSEAAGAALARLGWPRPTIAVNYSPSASKGTSLTLWSEDEHGNLLGSDGLGAPGRPAEEVGHAVAEQLAADVRAGATVDRHLADHLVPWIALGAGAVRVPVVTDHLTTNVDVCRSFLGETCLRLDGFLLRRG